jgi:hypothetical protein
VFHLMSALTGVRRYSVRASMHCLATLPRGLPRCPPPTQESELELRERLLTPPPPGPSVGVTLEVSAWASRWIAGRLQPTTFEVPLSTGATFEHTVGEGGFMAGAPELAAGEYTLPEWISKHAHRDDLDRFSRGAVMLSNAYDQWCARGCSEGIRGRVVVVPDKGPKVRVVSPSSESLLTWGHFLRHHLFPTLFGDSRVARSLSEQKAAHCLDLVREGQRRGFMPLSLDLSAATDNLLFWFPQAVLRGVFRHLVLGEVTRSFWDAALTMFSALVGPALLTDSMGTYSTQRGILMGLPPTWFFLCALNLWAVDRANTLTGLDLDALICGDDLLVCAPPHWVAVFRNALTLSGAVVNEAKTSYGRYWSFAGVFGEWGTLLPTFSYLGLRHVDEPNKDLNAPEVPTWFRAGAICEQRVALDPTVPRALALSLMGLRKWTKTMRLPMYFPRCVGGGGLRRADGNYDLCSECCLESWVLHRSHVGDAAAGWPSPPSAWGDLVQPMSDLQHSYVKVDWFNPEDLSFLDVPYQEVERRVMAIQAADLGVLMGGPPKVRDWRWKPSQWRRQFWVAVRARRFPDAIAGCYSRTCRCPRTCRPPGPWPEARWWYRRVCDDLGGSRNWLRLLPGGFDKGWKDYVRFLQSESNKSVRWEDWPHLQNRHSRKVARYLAYVRAMDAELRTVFRMRAQEQLLKRVFP